MEEKSTGTNVQPPHVFASPAHLIEEFRKGPHGAAFREIFNSEAYKEAIKTALLALRVPDPSVTKDISQSRAAFFSARLAGAHALVSMLSVLGMDRPATPKPPENDNLDHKA